VFPQIASQILQKTGKELHCPSQAWKVSLVGEGAVDAGRMFDDTIAQMCEVRAELCLSLYVHLPALSSPSPDVFHHTLNRTHIH